QCSKIVLFEVRNTAIANEQHLHIVGDSRRSDNTGCLTLNYPVLQLEPVHRRQRNDRRACARVQYRIDRMPTFELSLDAYQAVLSRAKRHNRDPGCRLQRQPLAAVQRELLIFVVELRQVVRQDRQSYEPVRLLLGWLLRVSVERPYETWNILDLRGAHVDRANQAINDQEFSGASHSL